MRGADTKRSLSVCRVDGEQDRHRKEGEARQAGQAGARTWRWKWPPAWEPGPHPSACTASRWRSGIAAHMKPFFTDEKRAFPLKQLLFCAWCVPHPLFRCSFNTAQAIAAPPSGPEDLTSISAFSFVFFIFPSHKTAMCSLHVPFKAEHQLCFHSLTHLVIPQSASFISLYLYIYISDKDVAQYEIHVLWDCLLCTLHLSCWLGCSCALT